MRITLALVLVLTIACFRGKDTTAPASDPPAGDDAAAQRAVREYVTALTEDNLEIALNYDKTYRRAAKAARKSTPEAMWPEKEVELKDQMGIALLLALDGRAYTPEGSGPLNQSCMLVLQPRGRVDFSKLTVRGSKTSVQVDYADQDSAPEVLWQGATRKLKSATVSVTVEHSGEDIPYVGPRCEPVEGTFEVWEDSEG